MMAVAIPEPTKPIFGPQPGFQRRFLKCRASILIAGGAAGCGKTSVEIMDASRHVDRPGYAATIFRRTTKEILMPGSVWDQSAKFYPFMGATSNETALEWGWATNAKVKMAHLEHEKNKHDWQSAEVARILFDELTAFSEDTFFYMLSRNRTMCGVRPRMRATCNPDADSWVARLIDWWIEQNPENERYGLPIVEREGVLRWFVRIGDEMIWADTREEAARLGGMPLEVPRSLTFIPGRLDENKILETADPGYRHRLMALSRVQRERLLNGNWKVRAAAGEVFRRIEVTMLDAIPNDVEKWCRCWDLAATEISEANKNPDRTAGVLMGRRPGGRYVVADAIIVARRSEEVRKLVLRTAQADTEKVHIRLFQDPGQAGKDQAQSYIKLLSGFRVKADPVTGDKETNAEPFSAQWQAGNVDVVRGPWNSEYFAMMEGFPAKDIHDDPVDASSGAFKEIAKSKSFFDVL